MNVVILRGVLSRSAEQRVLASGDTLVGFEVSVREADGPVATVPVVWPGAPAAAATWEAGLAVVVTGRVRRRFFRAGGGTASRTEVVADAVVPARRPARAAKAVDAALARVEGAADRSG